MYNARKRKPRPQQAVPKLILETLRLVGVIGLSIALCLVLSVNRWPGMTVQSVGPNWFVIWVVAWSLKRTRFQGAIAGLGMGWLQDSLTVATPTHGVGLAIVGALTAHVYQTVLRFWAFDWLIVPIWVGGMTLMTELWFGGQWLLLESRWISPDNYWSLSVLGQSLVAIAERQWQPLLISAGLSGIWSPAVLWLFRAWEESQGKRKKWYR
jgi:rod shape-determining protein MreD